MWLKRIWIIIFGRVLWWGYVFVGVRRFVNGYRRGFMWGFNGRVSDMVCVGSLFVVV